MLKSINRRVPVLCAKGIKRQRVERKQHECFRGDLPKHRKFDRHRKTGTGKQAPKNRHRKTGIQKTGIEKLRQGRGRYSGTDFENGK